MRRLRRRARDAPRRRAARAAGARTAADQREATIDFRLVEQPASVEGGPARYLILVKDGEAAAALQSLAELIAPHETGGDMRAIETAFDPEQGYLQCPACGSKTAADAKECPECGLGLGLADE